MKQTDWQSIVEKTGPAVWKTAYRLLNHRAEAEDCFQETFLNILEVSRRTKVRDFRALAVSIANSRAIDRLRKRYTGPQLDNSADTNRLSARAEAPHQRLESLELAEKLRYALSQLSSQEAEVFCLRTFSELSYREIAGQLNIKAATVGVVLHRARNRLRHLLDTEVQICEARCPNE